MRGLSVFECSDWTVFHRGRADRPRAAGVRAATLPGASSELTALYLPPACAVKRIAKRSSSGAARALRACRRPRRAPGRRRSSRRGVPRTRGAGRGGPPEAAARAPAARTSQAPGNGPSACHRRVAGTPRRTRAARPPSRAGSRPGGRRRRRSRGAQAATTPAIGARTSTPSSSDVERQLELAALADGDPLVAGFAERAPRALRERLALEPCERLRRAEALARAADEQDARQRSMRHGSV